MSLSLIFTGANSVHIAKFRRDANFKAIALRTLIGRSAGAAIGISMAFAGYGVWSLVTQQLASTIFATLLVWLSSSYRPLLRLSLPRLFELFRFGISVLPAGVTGEIGRRVFIALAGYFSGTAAVGFLSISIRFVETFDFILSSGVSQIGLTLFSKRQDNPEALRRGYSVAKEYTVLIALPVFVGLAICADKIVPVVLGDQWSAAVPLVNIAAIGGIFMTLRQFNSVIFNAMGQPRLNVFISIFSVGIMLAGMLLFGKYGVVASIIAWAARQVVLFSEVLFVRRLLGIPVLQQIRIFLAPVIAAVIMAVCSLAIERAIVGKITDLFMLLVLVPSGALIYVFMIYVLKRDLLRRFIIFVSHGFQERKSSAGDLTG